MSTTTRLLLFPFSFSFSILLLLLFLSAVKLFFLINTASTPRSQQCHQSSIAELEEPALGIGLGLELCPRIMENDYFTNVCWQAMEMNLDTNQSQSPDCFYNNSNWENSTVDQGAQQFESALSSIGSSPTASNSNVSGESHMIRELIGKLGKIGHSSVATSCYSTPMNSPPKMNLTVIDHLVKEKFPALNSTVAELSADPGFAERAARFSCFGSQSFSGRTAPYALNNNNANFNHNGNSDNLELPYGSSPSMSLSRVSSSPSLKALGPQIRKKSEIANSQEVSSISEQNPGGETVAKTSIDLNSRKRKAVCKGKAKDSTTIKCSSDDSNMKRIKNAGDGIENDAVKTEDEKKKNKDDAKKPPEPPKDYIHVRARRGQATDSHSLAERVRREKISERMNLLQDLVPGCNKVIGKALMLDEIINYVQSLQRQVEFLSMKLSTVTTTTMDFNMEALVSSKDMFHPNNHPIFETSEPVFHGQGAADGTLNHGSAVDPSCRGLETHLSPPLNDLQYQNFYGGDLQTIVEMGFGQNSQQDSTFQVSSFPNSSSAASPMKTEI